VIGFVCVGTGCRKAVCCCQCLECGSDSLVSVTVWLGCVMAVCSQGGHPPGKFGELGEFKIVMENVYLLGVTMCEQYVD